MKIQTYLYALTAAAIALSGCSQDNGGNDFPTPEPEPTPTPAAKMEIRINPTAGATKATDQEFENGDRISLYVVNYDGDNPGTLADSGNYVDNMRFTYSGSWTPDEKIYWKDATTRADIYLVYPYQGITSVGGMVFSVSTDQSSEESYKACDLMIGKASGVTPTEDAVNITANHVMSRLSIKLEPGNGFTQEELDNADVSVRINGFRTSASIDIASSTVTPTGEINSITPFLKDNVYRAYVFPQSTGQINLITITVNGKEYNFKNDLSFNGGRNYGFSVKLAKTSAGINVSIGEWFDDGTDFGGTAE